MEVSNKIKKSVLINDSDDKLVEIVDPLQKYDFLGWNDQEYWKLKQPKEE